MAFGSGEKIQNRFLRWRSSCLLRKGPLMICDALPTTIGWCNLFGGGIKKYFQKSLTVKTE